MSYYTCGWCIVMYKTQNVQFKALLQPIMPFIFHKVYDSVMFHQEFWLGIKPLGTGGKNWHM